jgi:opacity protein-like surface antigen
VCLSFGVFAANAQIQFHAGVAAGVPITDTLSSSSSSSLDGQDYSFSRFHSDTKRLLIGPSFRVDLTKALGLEFDALYQRVDYDSANINRVPEIPYLYQSFEAVHADRWQFPLLVQYSCAVRKTRPFVEAGPAITTIGNSKGSFSSTSVINLVNSGSTNSISGGRDTRAGITAGAGLDVPILHAHVRPEFRYSHWFQSTGAYGIASVGFEWFLLGNVASTPLRSEQNEASFLLSLSF